MEQAVTAKHQPMTIPGMWSKSGLLRLLLGVAALVVLALSVMQAVRFNLDFTWTSIRVAPSFALIKGLPLFSTPDRPPWVTVGYGPLYPVAYLPCTLGRTPVTVVWIATLLAYLYLLAPVALISRWVCRSLAKTSARSAPDFLLVTLCFALMALTVPSLDYVMTYVHVDAPAFGLLLMAVYFSLRAGEQSEDRSLRFYGLSGLFCGLSLCCKVNLLPSLVALVLFNVWARGLRNGLAVLVCAVVAVTAVYAWAVKISHLDAILLNAKIFNHFPWSKVHIHTGGASFSGESTTAFTGKVETAVKLAWDYLVTYGWTVLVAVVLLGVSGVSLSRKAEHSAERAPLLFGLLAPFLLPASIVSFGKQGGDLNSCALFSLPLTLGVLYTVVYVGSRGETAVRNAISIACILLAPAALVPALASFSKSPGATSLEEAYATVKQHPGEYYFPFDPLSHVLNDEPFRPSIDVLFSYAVSGNPVSKEAFQRSMPSDLKVIAVSPIYREWGLAELQRLMPGFEMTPNTELKRHDALMHRANAGEPLHQ